MPSSPARDPQVVQATGNGDHGIRWPIGDVAELVGRRTVTAMISWLFQLTQLPDELSFIVRLRLDAALYQPAPKRQPGTKGRPRKKGDRLPTLVQRAAAPKTHWQRVTIRHWYGEGWRKIEVISQTALWFHNGQPPLPVRWVLIRDPRGKFKTHALLCTDLKLDPAQIIQWCSSCAGRRK